MGGSPASKLFQGKYALGEVLENTPTLVVFRAEHAAIQRSVEIKMLAKGQPAQGPAAERLLREARGAGSVAHRSIQSVVDTGVGPAGMPYVVFEYLRGPTLDGIINSNAEGLPEPRAVSIILQLLEALNALHAGGVTHRALQSSLVRIEAAHGTADMVKLTGFSEAAFQSEGKSAPPPLLPKGSPYVAPEVIAGEGNGNSPNVDVYAAGVILQRLLLGPSGKAQRHLAEGLRRAISRATAASPRERFPSAALFLQALAIFDSSSESVVTRPSADALHADLRYLQRRRNTQMRRRDSQSAKAVMSQRAVLLSVEAVYKMTGSAHWPRFMEKVPEVDSLLPGAPDAEKFGETGVPMELFVRILAASDELCGRGDMVLLTALGETIGGKGVSRLAPGVEEPKSPGDFIAEFPKIWAAITSHGEATIIEQSPGKARIAVSDQPHPSLEFGAWLSGVMRGILRKAGAEEVEIVVPASQALGDAADVYGLSWKI